MHDFMTWLFQSQRVHDVMSGMAAGWAMALAYMILFRWWVRRG